jgi:hypothetical protein
MNRFSIANLRCRQILGLSSQSHWGWKLQVCRKQSNKRFALVTRTIAQSLVDCYQISVSNGLGLGRC